jgi:hypothetical protein
MNIDRVRKELQESALRDFPNPERVGCPDAETLAAMSRRIIQMTQDQLHHVTHCSPCFQTFLAIRHEMRQRRVVRIRIAAAACAAAIALGAIIYWTGVARSTPTVQIASVTTPATLDLRPLTENRGVEQGRTNPPKPPLILPRKHLRLTLYFPVGADEGQYALQLLDGQLRTLLKQDVTATLQDHIVTAIAELDLSSLSPGLHTLAIRKAGDEWRTYSVILQ